MLASSINLLGILRSSTTCRSHQHAGRRQRFNRARFLTGCL